jgi:hypothetical protein
MPATPKKPSVPSPRKKSPAAGKSKKPPAAAKPKKPSASSASALGDEGILIHTDEGFYYVSEEIYKKHKLPDEAADLGKVLVERGCLVASIPDDVAIAGCYCYLVSIANLNKTTG